MTVDMMSPSLMSRSNHLAPSGFRPDGSAPDQARIFVVHRGLLRAPATRQDDVASGGLAKTSFLHFSTPAIGFWRPAVHCLMGAIVSDLPKTQVVARSA